MFAWVWTPPWSAVPWHRFGKIPKRQQVGALQGGAYSLEPKADARHELKVVSGLGGSRDREESERIPGQVRNHAIKLTTLEMNNCVADVEARHDTV